MSRQCKVQHCKDIVVAVAVHDSCAAEATKGRQQHSQQQAVPYQGDAEEYVQSTAASSTDVTA
jgi:hypothetical protein